MAPIPAGWVQLGDTWVLWWNGRQIVNISAAKDASVRVRLNARKIWDTKDVRAASIAQNKRYAERWCAARLYPEMRLRAAVARLLDVTPSDPVDPLPGLPPTLEQRQEARRLAEAGAIEVARIKEALAPPRPPAGGLSREPRPAAASAGSTKESRAPVEA